MQRLTLFMIVVVTLFDFLGNGDRFGNGIILPSQVSYFTELMGALALVYMIVEGTRGRFQYVRPAYWLVFGSILVVMVFGVLVNGVDTGPIIAGIRTYLRGMAWFFVPAIFNYTDEHLRTQFKLLLGIGLLQLPLAILQRIQTADKSWGFVAITGDWTTGTLGDAGILSVFLVCEVCVIAALWERKQVPLMVFVTLLFALLVPTMINESKAMVVFLPLGLMAALLCAADPRVRAKRVVSGLAFLALFGAVFVPVYNQLNADREYSKSLGEFLSDPESLEAYVGSNSELGAGKEAGRGDAIAVPLRALSADPSQLMFGYGIGNASDSSLGTQFSGYYAALFRPFLQTQFAKFVLELGLSGVFLVLLTYWLIFGDARAVARADRGLTGSLAAGWTGVILIMCVCLFYAKVEVFPSMTYLFWFYSGVIAAKRMRLAGDAAERVKASMPLTAQMS